MHIANNLPTSILPAAPLEYMLVWLSGHRIGRGGVDKVNRIIYLDWAINIKDDSTYVGTAWLYFTISYFTD